MLKASSGERKLVALINSLTNHEKGEIIWSWALLLGSENFSESYKRLKEEVKLLKYRKK